MVRLGGDEFAVTLHSATPVDLDRLRNHLDGLRREQVEVGGGLLTTGFS